MDKDFLVKSLKGKCLGIGCLLLKSSYLGQIHVFRLILLGVAVDALVEFLLEGITEAGTDLLSLSTIMLRPSSFLGHFMRLNCPANSFSF